MNEQERIEGNFSNKNFLEEAIEKDLNKNLPIKNSLQTRFPPEPNGYLHIGHAKAICINFGLADQYHGKCNLRFDDTNPAKEDMEFVDAIKKDIEWLGFHWDNLFFASDYYDEFYDFACILIKKNLAYVDDQTADQIRQTRGTLTHAGTHSPYRNRGIEENMKLFENMRDGKVDDGGQVLRAKIDMSSPNINLRDPVIYRVLRANHYRIGDKWCIYPMYDFAHPLSDALEHITHSLCSLEFEDHRPLYDWFINNVGLWPQEEPRQIEFARLNLTRTPMSKRYLKKLVDEKIVTGWDDPRMPTLSGIRRRGYGAQAVRNFCKMVGVAKSNSVVDSAMLEFCVREDLGEKSARMMGILEPLKITIENWPEGKFEDFIMPRMPGKIEYGDRIVRFGRNVYIEKADFMENPPKKFFRLRPNGEVRLRGTYIIKCEQIIKDDNGQVIELICSYDPDSRSGENARKVKGTLHWVNMNDAIPTEIRIFDHLLLPEEENDANLDFMDRLNPDSMVIKKGFVEPDIANGMEGDTYQFMRIGYFCRDRDSIPNHPVFNQVVGLKDSWSKIVKKS